MNQLQSINSREKQKLTQLEVYDPDLLRRYQELSDNPQLKQEVLILMGMDEGQYLQHTSVSRESLKFNRKGLLGYLHKELELKRMSPQDRYESLSIDDSQDRLGMLNSVHGNPEIMIAVSNARDLLTLSINNSFSFAPELQNIFLEKGMEILRGLVWSNIGKGKNTLHVEGCDTASYVLSHSNFPGYDVGSLVPYSDTFLTGNRKLEIENKLNLAVYETLGEVFRFCGFQNMEQSVRILKTQFATKSEIRDLKQAA